MHIKLTDEAKTDLSNIYYYTYHTWGKNQANRYIIQIENRFQDLLQNPLLGRPRTDIRTKYRSLTEGRHIIFYSLNNEAIEIIGIPHASMDTDNYFEQIEK